MNLLDEKYNEWLEKEASKKAEQLREIDTPEDVKIKDKKLLYKYANKDNQKALSEIGSSFGTLQDDSDLED